MSDATFRIQAPYSTRALIKAKARPSAGVAEVVVRERADRVARGESRAVPRGGSLRFVRLLKDPHNWAPLAAYGFVRGSGRLYSEVVRCRRRRDRLGSGPHDAEPEVTW